MAARSQTVDTPAHGTGRVHWLDGVRGAAAMFVVIHHTWLTAWPSVRPVNPGPWWLGWLLYGRMAVATFIVVSGFSLALAPMRDGGNLVGGVRRFLRRRAWRILPAYWAALLLSVLISAAFLHHLGAGAAGKTVGVYGLMFQNVVGSANPNGALWSIAVEWQIYFVFPLILLIARRTSVVTAVLLTAGVVVLAHGAAGLGGLLDKINGLTPEFLALFALGVLAVWLGRDGRPERLRRPLAVVAAVTLGAFVALAAVKGSVWMVGHYFWIDLLFGTGVAAALALLYGGALAPVQRVFGSRALMFLGLFSYSIYLIHDPIVGVLHDYVFGPLHVSPLATFGLSLALGLPVVVTFCYGFHWLFEAPFLRHRGWSALRLMPMVRLWMHVAQRRRGRIVAPVGDVSSQGLVPAPQPATGERSAG